MNTLNLIKTDRKGKATHDAQINITKYRGVDCKVHEVSEETHEPTNIVVVLTSSDIMEAIQVNRIVSLGSLLLFPLIYSELRLLYR